MKRYLFITLLLALYGLSISAATGETPAAGNAYYIYNVGQGKYLTVNNGTVSLTASGTTQFTVADGDTDGTYTLSVGSDKLSTTFSDGRVVCSSDKYYDEWTLFIISSTDKTYALGCLEDEDNYAYSYIIHSEISDAAVSLASEVPSFADGQWMFVTSATPEEITYELGDVETPTVDYDATSATIKYTVISSKGETISCTHDVTFDANESASEIEAKGTFTDDTYNVTVDWTVKQSAKPAEQITQVALYQDNTSYSKPTNMAETVDVYLYRSALNAGVKNSFSVPFDMTSEQLSAAFGPGYVLYYYRRYNSTDNKVYYSNTTSIEAGEPYVVIPDATAKESDDEKAAREASAYSTDNDVRLYIIKDVASSSFADASSTVHGDYTYYSNFADQTFSGFYTFDETTDPGVMKYASTERELKGFRAYFKASSSSAKALTTVLFDDGEATEINSMETEDNLSIYNLNGQLVRKNAKNTKGLAKGIYIVNDKKVVIK